MWGPLLLLPLMLLLLLLLLLLLRGVMFKVHVTIRRSVDMSS
jgi:hypothetical protein